MVGGVSVQDEGAGAAAGKTAGILLREARAAAGIHIAALAVALKVPVNKLEALEADNYAVLPDTVFVRALASSVCRTLKIDAAPILALLPQSKSPRLAAGNAGINTPVRGTSNAGGSFSPSSSGRKSWAITVVVLALLVGALAIMFFPVQRGVLGGGGAEEVSAPPAAPAQEPEAPLALSSAPAVVPPVATALAPAAVDAARAAVPAAVPPAAAAASAAVASSVPASGAVAASASVLTLNARGASWVQVRDAAGTIALQRNLAVGESVAVSGTLPLNVVIGRADATDVFVRGKPFALTTVSRDNVARFEVK